MIEINWDALISSGLGALIGSAITLLATIVAHCLNQANQKEQEKSAIKATLQAIQDEIESLWDNYMDSVGQKVESLQPNQPLLFFFPVTQDYFTVYSSNAQLIGKVEREGTRKLIISTYAKAKGLIDSYKMNNEMLSKYENISFLVQQTGTIPLLAMQSSALAALTNYAVNLQSSHYVVKQQVSELVAVLKQYSESE